MSKEHAPLEVVTIKAGGERILLSGDWHGDVNRGQQVVAAAKRYGCEHVIVLGDFGYWEHQTRGVQDLNSISKYAQRYGVSVDFIDGNHDNHPLLWSTYKEAKRNQHGFWEIRANLHYIERGLRWQFGSTRFAALGGANSTDKEWRLIRESSYTTDPLGRRIKPSGAGTLWWPTEDITEEDLSKAVRGGNVDVALTHDAPAGVDVPSRKDQPESDESRRKVRAFLDATKPKHLFHGHFHIRKTSDLAAAWGTTKVTGLGDNRGTLQNQVLVLEV